VRVWRARALGADPAWVPTLLRVAADGAVRAWTGPSMVPPLARRLGPRATVRVLRALGRVREEARREGAAPADGVGRKRFLQLCGGVVAAAGLTLAGRTPAFAQSETTRARAWVAAHHDRLPRAYADIVRHPVPYRKAILRELTPHERTRAWLDHLDAYRAAHPDLTDAQRRVVEDARDVASRVFLTDRDLRPEVRAVEEAAKREFGREGAAGLLARLGPADAPGSGPEALAWCICSTESDYCSAGQCKGGGCAIDPDDCGSLWNYDCNGLCD
jgi:hypothetical protein